MAQAARQPWTVDEFFAWQVGQEDRYELVNGQPLRMSSGAYELAAGFSPRPMAGALRVHNQIVINVLGELRGQLRGTSCRPLNGDDAVETRPGQVRRPDAGVECGPSTPDSYLSSNPKVLVEVLSPSTRDFDAFGKLDEYRSMETLDAVLLVEPNAPEVAVWRRGPDRGWARETARGLDDAVVLPTVGVPLRLADVYDGVVFPTRR